MPPGIGIPEFMSFVEGAGSEDSVVPDAIPFQMRRFYSPFVVYRLVLIVTDFALASVQHFALRGKYLACVAPVSTRA
jgi:hypothetical protein